MTSTRTGTSTNTEAAAKAVAPRWAKELARRGLRGYGTATAGRRPPPDYLIIGTKRGGSTSLWKNLRSHPQVLSMFPRAENLKSPHFFDIHWTRGERWYRSYFPTEAARARREAATGAPVVVGDASPYYLFHPRAADRAQQVVPRAKVIVALRHPVDRAWSHYQERRKEGTEPLGFEEALDAEAGRLAAAEAQLAADPGRYSETHDFCSYLARGRYLEQLVPWLDRFGPSSVLVLRSESYYKQPDVVLREVLDFLGLHGDITLPRPEHMNRLPAAPLADATRRRLEDYYRPHVAALEAALDRDFGWDLT